MTETAKKTVKKPAKKAAPKPDAEATVDVTKDRYFHVEKGETGVLCGACGCVVLDVDAHESFHRVVAPQ